MRRLESNPEEQREIEEALSRAATPTHEPSEQDTIEFDSREVIRGLGEFGVPFGHPQLKLRDPPEHGGTRHQRRDFTALNDLHLDKLDITKTLI